MGRNILRLGMFGVETVISGHAEPDFTVPIVAAKTWELALIDTAKTRAQTVIA